MAEFTAADTRQTAFAKAQKDLDTLGFKVVDKDFNRPWGGFFVIDETQAQKFAAHFFPEVKFEDLKISEKLSPKILMLESKQRLSWQYHHRRAEIWKLVGGEGSIVISPTDEQTSPVKMKLGEIIRLQKGIRHRAVGLDGWGMIAEIWQHTDAKNPSNEDDIVRVEDDFGR
ncbi:MAG TPA: phosphoheptose isomerase [Cyclobacteriaceae bacterium]|nr:phosphoheptose isomerase [Cyclobacteriaceae bacterium]